MLRRHVSGDTEAFGILFSRHRERLWAVAVRTLGNVDDAADALQDAMISAFRRAGSFRGDSAVTTWLHRIVVNACLDLLRRQAARPATSGLAADTMDALAAHGSAPRADSDTALDVTAALRTLPPDQRAALVLVDMLGYPVADAAEVLGISEGTVKSRCSRGRARLLPQLAHLRGSSAAAPTAGSSQIPPTAGPTGTTGRNRSAAGDVSPARDVSPAEDVSRAGGIAPTGGIAPAEGIGPAEGGGERL